MNNIKEKLSEILDRQANSPFLFIGSGFSRRYLGLETWEELLRLFSSSLYDFNYYLARSSNDLSLCAELIANDYFEFWWKSPDKKSEREEHKNLAIGSSSPLKIAISQYLYQKSTTNQIDDLLKKEIEVFKEINAHGFITTNWDLLLENLFPHYKVFVGQSSIVTGMPQNVGEISLCIYCWKIRNLIRAEF